MVHVYNALRSDLSSNGSAIIHPTSGTVRTEENGVYDAEFTVPIDEFGKFQYLQVSALVKIPVRYHSEIKHQLFRVYDTEISESPTGANIKVKARHIFYDLTNKLLPDCRPTQLSGQDALSWMFAGAYDGEITDYAYSSDIVRTETAYYQNKNITEALLGAENAFVKVWGGSLYRDNFYFSINKEMEKSVTTGVIRYGFNMQSINFKTNISKCITYLIAEDNFGNKKLIINQDVPNKTFPMHIYDRVYFKYETENKALFEADAQSYFDKYSEPSVSVKAKIADLHDVELYKDYIELSNYEVGDRVIIYHSDLGISYKNLKIIAKTYDFVNDKTEQIEIGSFRDAIIREVA